MLGRARASDWSGSAATGREPPSNPWRGIMATGVARTGETRDAEVRRGAEAAGSREGPGPPDRNDKFIVDSCTYLYLRYSCRRRGAIYLYLR